MTPATGGSGEGRAALGQAAREPARRQCMAEGHDLDIVHAGTEPIQLVCGRGCGHAGWTITPILCPPGHLAAQGER